MLSCLARWCQTGTRTPASQQRVPARSPATPALSLTLTAALLNRSAPSGSWAASTSSSCVRMTPRISSSVWPGAAPGAMHSASVKRLSSRSGLTNSSLHCSRGRQVRVTMGPSLRVHSSSVRVCSAQVRTGTLLWHAVTQLAAPRVHTCPAAGCRRAAAGRHPARPAHATRWTRARARCPPAAALARAPAPSPARPPDMQQRGCGCVNAGSRALAAARRRCRVQTLCSATAAAVPAMPAPVITTGTCSTAASPAAAAAAQRWRRAPACGGRTGDASMRVSCQHCASIIKRISHHQLKQQQHLPGCQPCSCSVRRRCCNGWRQRSC